ncbi:MAG: hypothetical protein WC309_01230 [Candidatus Paceibacterota bacterium]|jgi:hypothetical protein
MPKKRYNFTKADIEFRRHIEKKRGKELTDEEFYKFIEKQKEWFRKYVEVVKKWAIEKPYEAEQLKRLVDSWEEKEKSLKFYDELAKIKKLPIAEIEKLLTPILEKFGYKNLQFSKPEFGRSIKVEFTAQEAQTARQEYGSRIGLQNLIKQSLFRTNWKLMSEGISYRLGFLQGCLIGIENEDDLKELVKIRNNLLN